MRFHATPLARALALAGFCAAPLQSQTSLGQLEGFVFDQQRSAVPGALVSATGDQGSRSVVTAGNGAYHFLGLPAGSYELKVELVGFSTQERRVLVRAGTIARFDFVLAIAGLNESISVVGESPRIHSRSATSSAVYHGAPGLEAWRWPSAAGSTATFSKIDENPFLKPRDNPRSTFSIDVDSASYAIVRSHLRSGQLPPRDAVRIEELLNYFRYDYPQPANDTPIAVVTEAGPCPWNSAHRLVHIGLQARRPDLAGVPPRNLVFLLDVSGSMQPANRLPLVKSAMALLAEQLREQDSVAIVVYAGAAGLILPPTRGSERRTILEALDRLQAGGSTHGAEGIRLAYQVARESLRPGGVNRVILATDGDFNVGVTSPGELVRLIEKEREGGVFLSVLGVGDDNLKDATMEQLADRGNGNYAYLDGLDEARKVLVREAGATLVTVAKDVKLQVEFNPARVAAYRLIGYENRALRPEDFKDDRKDAGEMGAGHTVTALYELVPAGTSEAGPEAGPELVPLRYQEEPRASARSRGDELLTVAVRYKPAGGGAARELASVLRDPGVVGATLSANLGFAAAVAELGLLLRDSEHKGQASFEQVLELAGRHRGPDPDGDRAQFEQLAALAADLSRTQAARR